MSTLPSPRAFLTALFNSLHDIAPSSSSSSTSPNPLLDASEPVKSLFLTIHCLFPNELLPALDLLDRRLVTRLQIPSEENTEGSGGASKRGTVYYVASSQSQRAGRYHGVASVTHYEVRLNAWNCSCPAFTFMAFGGSSMDAYELPESSSQMQAGQGEWQFGGVLVGEEAVPVCKHLLACVLVERCRFVEGMVEERAVTKEEMAGWAAGWGG